MDKQEKLEDFLVKLYFDDDNISGIFISGSLANNTYDQYSDVDIRYIFNQNDDNLIKYYQNDFKEKLNGWINKVLFYEPCYFNNALIPHFDNFIKADAFFYTQKMLTPSVWLKDIKVVKDQNGFCENIKAVSQNLQNIPSVDSINNDILKYFACSHECYRGIKRNEFLYADYLLDSMKFIIINFLDFIDGNENIGWKNVEKRYSKEIVSTLNQRIINEKEGLQYLTNINDLFFENEKKLCTKFNILRNFDFDYTVLSYHNKF